MESFFKGIRFSGFRVYVDYETHKKALQLAKDMADGKTFGKKKEKLTEEFVAKAIQDALSKFKQSGDPIASTSQMGEKPKESLPR